MTKDDVGSYIVSLLQSDTGKAYLKLKVEDAKNACKCALKEGMVVGAGVALCDIAMKLGEDNERHYEDLSAPHKTNPPAITRRRITLEELAQTVRLSTVLRSSYRIRPVKTAAWP